MWFVFGCATVGFYWNFSLPLKLGLLARLDATGRGSVWGGSISSAGSAIGPLLAGALISSGGYDIVGWMAIVFCVTSLFCVWLIERRLQTPFDILQAA